MAFNQMPKACSADVPMWPWQAQCQRQFCSPSCAAQHKAANYKSTWHENNVPWWKCTKMAELPPFLFPSSKTTRLNCKFQNKHCIPVLHTDSPFTLCKNVRLYLLSQERTWGWFVVLCHDAASWDILRLAAMALWVSTGSDGYCHPRSKECVVCICGGVSASERW